jgi:tRNA (guanine-N7-)-methyltransferase
MTLANVKYKRSIRSYVSRGGRMTARQQHALEHLWQRYGLTVESICNFNEMFKREAPTFMEIGFGMGSSLIELARKNPDHNYIGIEVHRPGIGLLLAEIEQWQISNVRVFCTDAFEILQSCIPDSSLNGVLLFFPDPWPKKRHHKRRIVQPSFVALVAQKLKSGGYFHLATDVKDYANHMLAVVSLNGKLSNAYGTNQFALTKQRPLTKFEQRGQRLGHSIWDLVFIKN